MKIYKWLNKLNADPKLLFGWTSCFGKKIKSQIDNDIT